MHSLRIFSSLIGSFAGCGLFALLALACGPSSDPADTYDSSSLPAGAHVEGSAPAMLRILDRLSQMEGTPAARLADSLRIPLAKCARFEGHAGDTGVTDNTADIEALAKSIHCMEASPGRGTLARIGKDKDLAFVLPTKGEGRVIGTATVGQDASFTATLQVEFPEDASAALQLLLPSEPPGPSRLNGRDAILHARIRPLGGLNLARLVEADSQAANLFRLKNDLFTSTVLTGVWELALYPPRSGDRMPGVALAIEHRAKSIAAVAMDTFVEDIQSRWPVSKEIRVIRGQPGACLPNLNIMPELAPCYVVGDQEIVIGWNEASLDRSLTMPAGEALDTASVAKALDESGGAFLNLAKLSDRSKGASPLPYQSLRIRGRQRKKNRSTLILEAVASPDVSR